MDPVKTFGNVAKGLGRNPIGIIALFIVLIYGFASILVGFGDHLTGAERQPIIWFLVAFPIVVIAVFVWLVTKHHTKLYSPSDYQDDEGFLRASKSSFEAAVALGAATAKWTSEHPNVDRSRDAMQDATRSAAQQIYQTTVRRRDRPGRKKVLWVDDRPENNVYERQALETFGIEFTLATSTDEALAALSGSSFDAIISDMGRPPDDRAGYTLLAALRNRGDHTPFLIYAGSKAPHHVAEARERGAQGTTNRPDELVGMVLDAVGLN